MAFDLSEMKLSRRDLLAKAGAVGLGATALTAFGMKPAEAATATVADVFNFALNLEYLEAEFYTYATQGHGINGVQTFYGTIHANPNAVTGGAMPTPAADLQQVAFPDTISATVAAQITADEQAHVALLQGILGSLAIPEPFINLGAMDAMLPAGTTSYERFLVLSRSFEDTGVSAYSGGSTLVRSNSSALQYAAQILAVEAYHASQARLLIAQLAASMSGSSFGAPKLDPLDMPPPPTGNFFFSVGEPRPNVTNALAVTRNTSQVLGIAYGASTPTSFAPAGTNHGGFFPNGVNGNIRTV